MTAEYLTALAAIVAIAISFRTSSHTELRSLYDSLREDFRKYRVEAEEREARLEKRLTESDENIGKLKKQIIRYEKYISKLIRQLEENNIIPFSIDPDQEAE